MKFKGAIFDMDGTIIDSLMFWDSLWKSIGERYLNASNNQPKRKLILYFGFLTFH